jgi:hypothetical protein
MGAERKAHSTNRDVVPTHMMDVSERDILRIRRVNSGGATQVFQGLGNRYSMWQR